MISNFNTRVAVAIALGLLMTLTSGCSRQAFVTGRNVTAQTAPGSVILFLDIVPPVKLSLTRMRTSKLSTTSLRTEP